MLHKHRVPFITSGKNVKRGHLNIRCVFCGSGDPSYHMGIDPQTSEWACWRNAEHRGKSPVRLLMRLLSIGYSDAREICGLSDDYIDPDGFGAFMNKLRAPVEESTDDAKTLALPDDFMAIGAGHRSRYHLRYLVGVDRKFLPSEVPLVVNQYGLGCSLDPKWRDRIIMPYYEDGRLVAWTARAITRAAEIRYKDLSIDESLVPIKHTLFNAPAMYRKACGLLIHEGPFDAVKADFHGRRLRIRSVALSTATISDQQVYRIAEHAQNFDWIGVCLDQSSQLEALVSSKMVAKLGHMKTPVRAIKLPAHWKSKDFGGASTTECVSFLNDLSHGAFRV